MCIYNVTTHTQIYIYNNIYIYISLYIYINHYIYIYWYLLMSTIPRIWSFRSHCSGERHQSAPDPIAWPKGGRLRRLGVGRASRFFAAGLAEDSSNAMFMECLGCRISQLILGFYGNLWGLKMSEWDLTWSKKLLSGFMMFYGVLMGCCVLRRVLTMSNTWKYSLRNSPVDGLMYRTMNWRLSVGDYERLWTKRN